MTTCEPFILKIKSPPYESENSQFQLTFSTIMVFHFFSACNSLKKIFQVPFNSFEFEKIRKFALRWPWSSKAERIQLHQSGHLFTFQPKIYITLFSYGLSDAERIKIDAWGLVRKLRGRHPEGFITSNPNEHLVKKPLSLLEHATDEGIHNEFLNRSCKCGQCQQLCCC